MMRGIVHATLTAIRSGSAFQLASRGSRREQHPCKIEWIENFLTLANAHAFSRAAERRNILQPTFSRHIQVLEDWLGVELD
jgi:hypothetical protein